jgi:hypothetical protein
MDMRPISGTWLEQRWLPALAIFALACGCGSNDRAARDLTGQDAAPAGSVSSEAGADEAQPAPYSPAEHAPFPQVLSAGGPVLNTPTIVPIFFANDPDQAQIEQFLMELATSTYWSATTAEYGVGALRVAPSIVVSDAAPASLDRPQIAQWLAPQVASAGAPWPAFDPGNVYVVFYPQSTSFSENGATSCSDIGGFHSSSPLFGAQDSGDCGGAPDGGASADAEPEGGACAAPSFVYAAIARCASFNDLSGIDALTAALSHELVESATDPLIESNPAYGLVDFDHFAWDLGFSGTVQGSELGDMCVTESSPAQVFQRLVGNFVVQRTWSNRAAEANTDPCVPAIMGPYFNAAPDVSNLVGLYASAAAADAGVNPVITTGVSVPTGQSRTFALRVFSTGPTSNLTINLFGATLPSPRFHAAFAQAPGATTLQNGDIVSVTITRTADAPLGGDVVRFVTSTAPIKSLADPGANYNSWNMFIGN